MKFKTYKNLGKYWIFAGYIYLYTVWREVFYLCFWCELCMHGCIHYSHCRVSPPHCRDYHSRGQRGRTPVLCRYTGWPLNCPQPESRTALPPVRPSTWSPECQCWPWWPLHPLDNRVLKDTGNTQVNRQKHIMKKICLNIFTSAATYRWCSWEPVLQDCCQPGLSRTQTSGKCGHTRSGSCSCCWWYCRSPLRRQLSWWKLSSCQHKALCPTSACSFLLVTPREPKTLVDRGLRRKDSRKFSSY